MKAMRGPCIALGMVVLSAPATAQTRARIGNEPSCTACRVVLEPVVRLGDDADPAGFAQLVEVAVSSSGRYVVSSGTFDGQLFVYGPDGKLQRTIGRHGGGPGEFERQQFVAFDAADSLHTFDMSGPRHSVFAPDFTFVRAVQQEARSLGVALEPSGDVFMVSPKLGRDSTFTLQVFDADGRGLFAFDGVPKGAGGQAALGRSIAVDARGRRWSIGAADYTIREWDSRGELDRSLIAKRDWIPETIPLRLEPGQRPPAQIIGLQFDEAGLLWVFAAVPAEDAGTPAPGTRPDPAAMYDTLLEVIDPATGSLVARSRVDPVTIPFGRGRAYSMVEVESGDLRLQVWRMRVTGREVRQAQRRH